MLPFPSDRVESARKRRRRTERSDVTIYDKPTELEQYRDCVVEYKVGPGYSLLVAWDELGGADMEVRLPSAWAGGDTAERLHDFVRPQRAAHRATAQLTLERGGLR